MSINTDTELFALEKLDFDVDIPCESPGHKKKIPPSAIVWAKTTRKCCNIVTSMPLCESCYDETQEFMQQLQMKSSVCICTRCNSKVGPGDLIFEFMPLKS